jgi:hypothetical protein
MFPQIIKVIQKDIKNDDKLEILNILPTITNITPNKIAIKLNEIYFILFIFYISYHTLVLLFLFIAKIKALVCPMLF